MKLTPRPSAVYLTIGACLVAEAAVLRVGVDDLDEGYFVQQAARVLRGQVPYRDFQSLYTPGLLYVHAALLHAFGALSQLLADPSSNSGVSDILVPRGFSLLCRVGIAVLLYVLARPVVQRRPWLAAGPAVLLLAGLDDAPIRWEPHPGWPSTFFALLAVWCLTHPPERRWLLASGAAAAATYAFKQNTGVFILAAILALGLLTRRARREVALPLGAFVCLTLLWLGPLVVALGGDLRPLGPFIGAVNQAGLFAPPELTIAVPLACLVGGLWLGRAPAEQRLRWYLLSGAALFLTQYPRLDTTHLAWSAPLLFVLGVAVLDRLSTLGGLAVLLVAFLLEALPALPARFDYLQQSTTILSGVPFANGLRLPPATAHELQGLVADVQQRTAPGEPIFVYPSSPLVYAIADRPNPTPFDHLYPGAASPTQLQALIQDLSDSHVQLIVISDYWVSAWGPAGPNSPLLDWIDGRFAQIARYGAYRVLQARL